MVFLALRAQPGVTAEELARGTRVRVSRVQAILHGELPEFAPGRALLALGLARATGTPFGLVYELTAQGEHEADAVTLLRLAGRPV
ncbi:MAG: hypothetical protein QOE90_1904 [Thermoplasmata archaeon]|nr:hypothetical protein [Thermoplasmata archaeon]